MNALHEAGWVAWFAVVATVIGAVHAVLARRLTIATTWAVGVVIVAMLNASVGQHKVDAKVAKETDPARAIAMLSTGTREASSNLFVGANGALVLIAVGAIAERRRRRRTNP